MLRLPESNSFENCASCQTVELESGGVDSLEV